MLVVTETFKPPHHVTNSSALAPKKPVPMPSGLKVRFTTFGSGKYRWYTLFKKIIVHLFKKISLASCYLWCKNNGLFFTGNPELSKVFCPKFGGGQNIAWYALPAASNASSFFHPPASFNFLFFFFLFFFLSQASWKKLERKKEKREAKKNTASGIQNDCFAWSEILPVTYSSLHLIEVPLSRCLRLCTKLRVRQKKELNLLSWTFSWD